MGPCYPRAVSSAREDVLRQVARLKELMVGRATGTRADEQTREYGVLRHKLLGDRAIADQLPECVRTCRTMDEFWAFISEQSATYKERREFLRVAFDQLLTFLEQDRHEAAVPARPAPSWDTEAFLSRVVELLKMRGCAREVAILAAGKASFEEDPYDTGFDNIAQWCITVRLPAHFYTRLDERERGSRESRITATAQELYPAGNCGFVSRTDIVVDVAARENWKEHAKAWLRGAGTNNQGRVRSDNLPSREIDGLLFRSWPEVHLYQALKTLGVAFAPLPVFLRGGDKYQRLEPDFVVLQEGAVLVIEVDGDPFHVESPAEADERTRIFKHEGALIERVRATACDTPEKAVACAKKLLADFERWRRTR